MTKNAIPFLVLCAAAAARESAVQAPWLGDPDAKGRRRARTRPPVAANVGNVRSRIRAARRWPSASAQPWPSGAVWQRVRNAGDHDIHYKRVTPAGALVTTAPRLLDNSGWYDARPSISNSCGPVPIGAQRLCDAWERRLLPTDHDIYAAMLAANGDLLTLANGFAQVQVAGGPANQIRAAISTPTAGLAQPRQLLCAWEDATSANGDIGIALVCLAGQVLDEQNLSALNSSAAQQSWFQSRPCVESDGVRLLVGHLEGKQGSATDLDAWVTLVAPVNGLLQVQDAPSYMTASQYLSRSLRLASRYAGSGVHSRRYAHVDDDWGAHARIYVRTFDGYQGGWQLRPRTAGCGGGVQGFAYGLGACLGGFELSNGFEITVR